LQTDEVQDSWTVFGLQCFVVYKEIQKLGMWLTTYTYCRCFWWNV